MKLLCREIQKHYRLLVIYGVVFLLALILFPLWLKNIGYFNMAPVIKGDVSNMHELIWWLLVILLPVLTMAVYWSRESTVFYLLEFVRFDSFRKWLKTKLDFVLIIPFSSFLIMGVILSFVLEEPPVTILTFIITIGVYMELMTGLMLVVSLFISSISIILIMLFVLHTFIIYIPVSQGNLIFLGLNGSIGLLMSLLGAVCIALFVFLKIGRPSHLMQRRSERN